MRKIMMKPVSWFLILWFPLFTVAPVFGQDDDIMSETYFYDDSEDEEEETEETSTEKAEKKTPVAEPEEEKVAPPVKPKPATPKPVAPKPVKTELVTPKKEKIEKPKPVKEDIFQSEYDYKDEPEPELEYTPTTEVAKKDTRKSLVQNAVIEGIQLSSEPGESKTESIVSCYFIFRDKPTSYFYESKVKDNLIIFEFNDVELGSSPVPSAKLTPIQKFKIRQEKVDANKDIVGLKPEWHDVVKVTFYLDAVPIISVKDEYSVISFSFKWSTDPDDNKENIAEGPGLKHPGWFWSSIGAGVAAAGGVGIYLYLNKDDNGPIDPIPTEIDISDRPVHEGN